MLVSLDKENRVKRENRSENIRMTRVNIKEQREGILVYILKKRNIGQKIPKKCYNKMKRYIYFQSYICKFISLDSGSRVQWCEVSSQTEHPVCCGTSSEPGAREAPSQGSPG